ncbi:RDD family protein [Streptomyces albidoflavus]
MTGKAVALELRPAKLLSRGAAVLIDLVVTWLVFLLVMVGALVTTASLGEAVVAAVSVAVFLLVPLGGPIAVETLSHGRSLGKWACGCGWCGRTGADPVPARVGARGHGTCSRGRWWCGSGFRWRVPPGWRRPSRGSPGR